MNKKIRTKLLIVTIMLLLLLPLIKIKHIDASSNLKVMTSSTGSELKYRNSQEKVYGLDQYDYPTSEYRAVWVSTFVGDIPSYTTAEKFKSDANQILDNMINMGMNAMVFHVRTHNNALYNSDLNPIASWWRNVNFNEFDPLEWLITECHNRGIEFHAWMNPYRVGGSQYLGEDYPANHPCKNPDLVLTNSSNSQILDPGSTIVQDFIVSTCMEFLERYDADAIHFDDYFYISGVKTELSGNQKRSNVDAFIEKLSNAMHKMNIEEGRAVQLGISPSGIYQNGGYSKAPTYDSNGNLVSPIASNTSGFAHYGEYLYSDTKKWIDNEWIDYITPQAYWGMEHTGANFYELTRWWSWCVKYKKVNLYMGMGIYMADGTGTSAAYWQRNEDEVKNQILNAGMYDEIHGLCLYKYSYLLNRDNVIIKNGVDLITNDYWKKRIPGAVIKRYADTLPSVKVDGLVLNNNSLSWNKVDNVFGYMVYQVPKGETLDTKNINHVLVYTQDNVVENIDNVSYDYYVSSVNRANVVSNPTKYGEVVLKNYEIVIASINNLPASITLDCEEKVNQIRIQYEKLTEDEKQLVTNYQVLVEAENTITQLKQLKSKVDEFLVGVDTFINTDRILPVAPNMKWSYKNIDDAKSYNIETGKRLKNYLTAYIITLYLEITENGLTYKQEVDVNLSLLKKGEIGLVYRNDPSSMSPDHVGQYTGTPSYIGWSNVTVTIGNYVLFIAKDNFFNLSTNDIPSCNWTSCAGVYHNSSNQNISMALSQAFQTASPTYGYFVIGSNNQIKNVSSDSSETVSVQLLPQETLVIIRFLDRSITNNPFIPITNLQVGTTAYITNYSDVQVTPQEEARTVIALINTIPSPLTLDDEELVNNVKNAYDNLSEEAKTYVTNYNELENAINTIANLLDELATFRQNAISSLTEGLNLENYSTDNKAIINNLINDAKNRINSLTNHEEINKVVTTTTNKIKEIKTIKEELAEYYQEKYQSFVNSIDMSKYSSSNQAKIQEIFNEISNNYHKLENENNLTNITIDSLFLDAQGKFNQILTLEDELSLAILSAKDEITVYSESNNYTNSSQEKIDEILYNALTELSSITSISQVSEVLAKYKSQIDEVPTFEEEVSGYRQSAINQLDTYIENVDGYSTNQNIKEALDAIYNETLDKINEEVNEAKINNLVEQAKSMIDSAIINIYANTCYEKTKSEINFNDYNQENQLLINQYLDSIKANITLATTKEDINQRVQNAKEEIGKLTTLTTELETKKQELADKLDNLSTSNLREDQIKALQNLKNEYNDKIEQVKSLSELSSLDAEIQSKYQSILEMKAPTPKPETSCKCAAAVQIVSLIMLSLGLVIIRKH